MQGMSFFGDSVRVFAQKPWLRQAFGIALIVIAVYVVIFNLQMSEFLALQVISIFTKRLLS